MGNSIDDVDSFPLAVRKHTLPLDKEKVGELLGIISAPADRFLESLPFSIHDTTAGSENELQVVVEGTGNNADLPLTIVNSNYFNNIIKRAAAGDTPEKTVTALEKFLYNNIDNVWENSWVRFPRRVLCQTANGIFSDDLRADKNDPCSMPRTDIRKFIYHEPCN